MVFFLLVAVLLMGIAYIVAREHGSARPLTAALKFLAKAVLAVVALAAATAVWFAPDDSALGAWRNELVGWNTANEEWGKKDPRVRRTPVSGNPFDKYQDRDGTCWSEPDRDGWQTQIPCR